jgi:hypothetical protein
VPQSIHMANDDGFNPADYFLNPKEPAQKRYEALRTRHKTTSVTSLFIGLNV